MYAFFVRLLSLSVIIFRCNHVVVSRVHSFLSLSGTPAWERTMICFFILLLMGIWDVGGRNLTNYLLLSYFQKYSVVTCVAFIIRLPLKCFLFCFVLNEEEEKKPAHVGFLPGVRQSQQKGLWAYHWVRSCQEKKVKSSQHVVASSALGAAVRGLMEEITKCRVERCVLTATCRLQAAAGGLFCPSSPPHL